MYKAIGFIVLFWLCLTAPAQADGPDAQPEALPSSVDAVVAELVAGLSAEDKQTLRSTPAEELILYHHGWGTGIRNHYQLWGGNEALLRDACGGELCHPDDASMVIIERVWQALQTR